MKKKPTKQTVSTPEYDPQRETNVLLGGLSKDIKTIAEQHGTIVKRLDNIESQISSVKMAVMEVDAKVNKLEGKVTDNSNQIKGLKTGQQEINQKLDIIITDHEQRLQKLEAIR